MNGGRSAERIKQEIVRLCHAGLDSRTFRVETVRRLRKVIPVDVSFFATADPATLLFTSAVVDDILARATPQFIENEFLKDDSVKFTRLARGVSPADSLGLATKGELARSPRYQEILAPTRANGLRPPLLMGGVGGAQVPPLPLDGPGLLLLGDDLSLAAITPAAEGWLAEVAESDWPSSSELPEAVYAVAARLLALERGGSHALPDLMPRTRLRTASGRWLVLHASRLHAQNTEGRIAVIFEEARPSEIAPVIVDAYGLTKRECEITRLVLRGLSTAEVSEELHITSNTVRDHFKGIFDKVGVRSRRELVGQIFAQQYHPRMATGHDLNADGWFT